MPRDIPIPHPGEVLSVEFLEPNGLSTDDVASAIGVTRDQLHDIRQGKIGISAGIALRLGRYFRVDPEWFLNLQVRYDLAAVSEVLAAELACIQPHEGT